MESDLNPEMQAYNAAFQSPNTAAQQPPAQPQPDYSSTLLASAKQKYPFISQYNPVVTTGNAPAAYANDYAETWLPGDAGDAQSPRPSAIPLNGVGVNVYKTDKFGPDDLAAEFLHADPLANQTRSNLLKSMSAAQIQNLKSQSRDYADTINGGESDQKAMQNATDSALRGYTVGQWPAEANAAMRYTPYQTQMLERLKTYMRTGVRPVEN